MAGASRQVQVCSLTAPNPGAIGIIQLHGPGAADLAEQLCGLRPTRRCRLAQLADVDEGLVVALRDDWAQIMPHGGVHVIQQLIGTLVDLGAVAATDIDPTRLYPEASSPIEAHMLSTLSRAASPAAVDRLLAQPALWTKAHAAGRIDWPSVLQTSRTLDQLLTPPRVVLVGPANVGKSTLTNQLAGRAASIVADLPGTTRDWVGTSVELPTAIGDVAVQWFDTPGLRDSDDPVEQHAIRLAQRVIASADLLIAMRDDEQDWPSLPRPADIFVINKIDRPRAKAICDQHPHALPLAADVGDGIEQLIEAAIGTLGLANIASDALWAFSGLLRDAVNDPSTLARCLGR